RIVETEARIAKAAGGKSPSNGYHSGILPGPDAVRWVEVDLGRSVALERVVLHPARPTDFPDTPGFGFPARFRVEVSERSLDEEAAEGRRTIEDHTTAEFPNPGDAAHVITSGGTRARFIRVTATRLWERTGDFVFVLAELEAFEGGANAALGASVRALDSIEAGRWGKARLVDGWSSRMRIASGPAASALHLHRAKLQVELLKLRAARVAAIHSLLDEATRSAIEETAARLDAASQALGALPPQAMVDAAASEFEAQGSFTRAVGPRPVHLLHRGEVKNRGELMAPGALSSLPGLESRFEIREPGREGEGRAALARWITNPRNVLTWRSIVNRVWQHHFGTGIVDTPSDFGRMGSKPTHPALLDWLASTFLEGGASLKDLHRLILVSAVYRQSSRDDPARSRIDSDNRFLWRMNRARLDAESVRDALLAVSGTLDLAMGGPSVEHFRFKDDHSPVYDYGGFDADSPASRRRSIYRFLVRSVPDPFMECLDCADPSILTPRRNTTLTALQALALLNTPFVLKQAEQLAGRVRGLSSSISGQVEAACILALGRAPEPEEGSLLVAHAEAHGLENALRLIFNLNEFLFID
ncbi:MAG TPA: DUF1553 domain-containing protein, partial [Planctomycetota bacterium]|nr:DUF1553 domain-containing protein [Planctomycetota bacterium]